MSNEEGKTFIDEVRSKFPNDIIVQALTQQLQAELKRTGHWNSEVVAKIKKHLGDVIALILSNESHDRTKVVNVPLTWATSRSSTVSNHPFRWS
jgi:hypothetical protein